MIRVSYCQCTSCNGPGFDPSIRRHSGIWGAADEAVLYKVRKQLFLFSIQKIILQLIWIRFEPHPFGKKMHCSIFIYQDSCFYRKKQQTKYYHFRGLGRDPEVMWEEIYSTIAEVRIKPHVENVSCREHHRRIWQLADHTISIYWPCTGVG